ncbi:hypothetical protein Pan216_27450 [Planctomycetes bacterium Pan216]|uniref:Biopolymer transport protein ExbD/TolR n=1 Tax=Kolteria novifilia TaxID=2527975 RepID=A0A518B4G7_9BACT|nr:hypothetical protein Pan216_27450 [Planctomycetes bacterium Pan216]
MKTKGFRRFFLDLTPMVDVIMILLFGVMINSVARTNETTLAAEEEVSEARRLVGAERSLVSGLRREVEAERDSSRELRRRLAEMTAQLSGSERDRVDLQWQLRQQRYDLADVIARVLGLDDDERLRFRQQLDHVSQAKAEDLAARAEETRSKQNPVALYKAIRRIEEMQKIFTFVDVHLDDRDFLTIQAENRRLLRLPARGRTSEEIVAQLSRTLESVHFRGVVLILFSYDGDARDLTVETTEEAVMRLVRSYRADGEGRRFRYGRIGMIDETVKPRPSSAALDEKRPQ